MIRSLYVMILVTAASIIPGAASPLNGQETTSHGAVKDILANIRGVSGEAVVPTALRIITQLDSLASPERADSLAEGLVAVAKDLHGQDNARAIYVLTYSANPTEGRPYEHAFDRIHDIFKDAQGAGAKGAAMAALGRVDVRRALPVWRQEATRGEADPNYLGGPTHAIVLLCRLGGAEGRSILLDLRQKGLVVDRRAANQLGVIVRSNFTLGGCAN